MHPPCNAVDALTSKTIFAQGESVVSTLNTNQSKASIEEGYIDIQRRCCFGGQNLFNSLQFSSYRPVAIHPILQIVLVQNR